MSLSIPFQFEWDTKTKNANGTSQKGQCYGTGDEYSYLPVFISLAKLVWFFLEITWPQKEWPRCSKSQSIKVQGRWLCFFRRLQKPRKSLAEKPSEVELKKTSFFEKLHFPSPQKMKMPWSFFVFQPDPKKIHEKMTSLRGVYGKHNLKKIYLRSLVYANACAPKL